MRSFLFKFLTATIVAAIVLFIALVIKVVRRGRASNRVGDTDLALDVVEKTRFS
ncbi:hypothetical protein H1S01_07430 [Heliobacterium chlorum]|uniref:Uncharacterized protein n=1 Tax=Heliobacterium chlorum TaxID=2698 RepID=A0ABR7T454_HELCL|nr:hypothetical protein [Heliobacterium chlorum]